MRRADIQSPLIASFLNYLYPSLCPSCEKPTDNLSFAPFCIRCWADIQKYSGPSCRICDTPFVSEYATQCQHCIERPPLFINARSFGRYDSTLASAIHHFKFLGVRRLSSPLSELLLFYDATGIDAIIPVPLSTKGLKSRGFNQSLLIANYVSKIKKVPIEMDALIKVSDTPPQIGLSSKEREANVKKAFKCIHKLTDKNILLIDDVMTTGATVNACTRQLLKAGAKSVRVLTLARAGMM